jgi:hypothetical protein
MMFGFIKKASSGAALTGARGLLDEFGSYALKNPLGSHRAAADSLLSTEEVLQSEFGLKITSDILFPKYHTFDFHRSAHSAKKLAETYRGMNTYFTGILVCAAFSILGAQPEMPERKALWNRILSIWQAQTTIKELNSLAEQGYASAQEHLKDKRTKQEAEASETHNPLSTGNRKA